MYEKYPVNKKYEIELQSIKFRLGENFIEFELDSTAFPCKFTA